MHRGIGQKIAQWQEMTDLMDMVALKIIERSRIPTVILRSSVTNIVKAIESDTKIGTRILV